VEDEGKSISAYELLEWRTKIDQCGFCVVCSQDKKPRDFHTDRIYVG